MRFYVSFFTHKCSQAGFLHTPLALTCVTSATVTRASAGWRPSTPSSAMSPGANAQESRLPPPLVEGEGVAAAEGREEEVQVGGWGPAESSPTGSPLRPLLPPAAYPAAAVAVLGGGSSGPPPPSPAAAVAVLGGGSGGPPPPSPTAAVAVLGGGSSGLPPPSSTCLENE